MPDGVSGLAVGATTLGLLHGLAPGHGWAIAASYALDKPNKWVYGLIASLLLGIGHLISSIAMVVVYFWALSYFGLTQLGWMRYVAGTLLITLGLWQYFNGHAHTAADHEEDHHAQPPEADTMDTETEADPESDTERSGWGTRLRSLLPGSGRSTHDRTNETTDRDLYGMAVLAFVLGFTHNEEFDIIAICTGSAYCLQLMVVYSVAVIVSLVGVTLLLVASYDRYEECLEEYADHLPTITAAILIIMGIGFVLGVF